MSANKHNLSLLVKVLAVVPCVSGAMMSWPWSHTRPLENWRGSEDYYRLTLYLGAPFGKASGSAWRDTVQGGQSNCHSLGGQCLKGWSSGGECRPLWAGSQSGLSAAQKLLFDPISLPPRVFSREEGEPPS